MKTYDVEITDLFCGELNYSYVSRLVITARSLRGAINKVARETGLRFTRQYGVGDWEAVYHSMSRSTGVVIIERQGD